MARYVYANKNLPLEGNVLLYCQKKDNADGFEEVFQEIYYTFSCTVLDSLARTIDHLSLSTMSHSGRCVFVKRRISYSRV